MAIESLGREPLAKHRARLGLTQLELAEKAGLERSLVNRYENGRGGLPGLKNATKLARALGVRIDDIAFTSEQSTL